MLPFRVLLITLFAAVTAFSQAPPIEPGVSQDLAKWRSARYSDIRYKLDLTLEKMSPVLKGHMEIRVKVSSLPSKSPRPEAGGFGYDTPIELDWRKIPGHEKDSTLSNVTVNGTKLVEGPVMWNQRPPRYVEEHDHLLFDDGVVEGQNVITLDFTSPILTSGSAITRYIDKEDGSEYIYSLFVPSDASTAFPVFDQPDLKARFQLTVKRPGSWKIVSNTGGMQIGVVDYASMPGQPVPDGPQNTTFPETQPISTYVFAFAAGPWTPFSYVSGNSQPAADETYFKRPRDPNEFSMNVFVRKSQAEKFKAHRMDVFRLTESAVKYLETYFDYKFPWPKYDLVLIPEFPFGGMEHAGATFLKESSVIFPTEPTRGDEISRANVIFHETAHQWFGDLVTMRWFDDLWLKEGFAEFMAYKTLEHVMPDANAWKVFYERNKQAAYATDSTRGTTPIYQPIANLSAAKSAYGNIVYRKAPSFLRQAEFYLGEDKFQTAVRAFLKKHAFGNAGWEDLVGEFGAASGQDLKDWGRRWVTQRGAPMVRVHQPSDSTYCLEQRDILNNGNAWYLKSRIVRLPDFVQLADNVDLKPAPPNTLSAKTEMGVIDHPLSIPECRSFTTTGQSQSGFLFPNYGDYGYGIFLLDDKSRDYVLKHIGEEKDPFLRSMMWGALWDSVREAELDPREYVELVIRQLGGDNAQARASARAVARVGTTEMDETIVASVLGRVSLALNYYLPSSDTALPHGRASATDDLRSQFEAVLLDRMQHAATPGQRITFYRAFVTNASTEHGRAVLKQMLAQSSIQQKDGRVLTLPASINHRISGKPDSMSWNATPTLNLRTKDKFDIVTRLIILGDPDAPKLLADLEKTETSDDAKRYAYAAHAAFATADNRAKFWSDFVNNKDISESWIEAAIGPFNSIRQPELSQPYLERALTELPNLKRTRKIFFINNWLAAWLGGQRDQAALDIVNKFLTDNPNLDSDLRLKVLENVDVVERAVKIRKKFGHE